MSGYDYLFKVIIIGDSGVGKSSLLFKLLERRFKTAIEPTIGIEFGTIMLSVDGVSVRLQIWDSAGQENYRSITRSYYRNTICAILVYDITSRHTFENIRRWLDDARAFGNPSMRFALIGNKTDAGEERQVSREEAEKFAQSHQMLFFESSAKQDNELSSLFELVVRNILEGINRGDIDPYSDSVGVKVGFSSPRPSLSTKGERKLCCK